MVQAAFACPRAMPQEPIMPNAKSRLSPDIDLDGDGKQTGFLRLPHSVHRSAYGWIPIPIAVHRQRHRTDGAADGRQSRRRIRRPGRARAADPRLATGRGEGPYHHPALGQFPGGDGRQAHLAHRRGQSQPQLSRRSRRRADRSRSRITSRANCCRGSTSCSTSIPAAAR